MKKLYKTKGWVFVEHRNEMLALCKEDELPEDVDQIGQMILNALAVEKYLNLEAESQVKH